MSYSNLTRSERYLSRILFGMLILGLSVMFMLLVHTVQAALAAPADIITVNVNTDITDGDCNDGTCSLRDAIATAIAGDEIQFDPTLVSPITLTQSPSQLTINQNLTITGPGADLLTITRTGAACADCRIFNIGSTEKRLVETRDKRQELLNYVGR